MNSDKFEESISNLDRLISKQREQIDALEELKRSLIHEHDNRVSNTDAVINMSESDLRQFKIIYQEAVDTDRRSFIFKENEFLTGFAKKVIEFMEKKV